MGAPLGPVLLEGNTIRLEPLSRDHLEPLTEAAQHDQVWAYLLDDLRAPGALERHIDQSLVRQHAGTEYRFVVVARRSGRVVGSTSYLDVSERHRATEIGSTWYVPEVWGTAVNPEAKYLLLKHAFEDWGAIRVFFKTDARNLRSQAAIKKLGAQYEGTFRSHLLLPDGHRRDSVFFSILDHEWPAVKTRLEDRLRTATPTNSL